MNNDLEQFSEERLKDMQNNIKAGMTLGMADALIIRNAIGIALAAKQAKPEYHIVRLELNDVWGSETVLNAYESQLDASKCKDDHGGVIIPCYTTPQPAHTEVNSPVIPDGWKLVPEEGTLAMLTLLGVTGSFSSMQQKYQNMLDAAPMYDAFLTNEDAKSDDWIKCSDLMPDSKNDVQLFCSDTREQFVGFHRGNGVFQFFNMNDVIGECEPTHWRPLASDPKPESE